VEGAIVYSSTNMKINADKEKRGAISVNGSKKPPIINVSTNVGNSREC
jgi:hypothetical protein